MAAPHVYNPLRPGFLSSFPGEIRNIIYGMLLSDQYAHQQGTPRLAPLHPTILQCNRRIFEEGFNLLHGKNIWIIAKVDVRHWPLLRKYTQLRSQNDTIRVEHPALLVELSMPAAVGAPQNYVYLVIGEEGIEKFIQGLWLLSTNVNTKTNFRASSLVLTLCKTAFHSEPKIRSICLKPFCLVYGTRKIIICCGTPQAGLEAMFSPTMSSPALATHVETVSHDYLTQGYHTFWAGDPMRACDRFLHGALYIRHRLSLKLEILISPHVPAALRALLVVDTQLLTKWFDIIGYHGEKAVVAAEFYEMLSIMGGVVACCPSLKTQMQLRLCMACAHREIGETRLGSQWFGAALNVSNDKFLLVTVLAEMFPRAEPELLRMADEQTDRLRKGGITDWGVLQTFWDTAEL